MSSVKASLLIEQGATFIEVINLNDANGNPLDVTGLAANGSLRKYYTSSNVTVFTTAMANGSLTISLTANQTGNLYPGRYVHDTYMSDVSNNWNRVVEGVATVTPSVTH